MDRTVKMFLFSAVAISFFSILLIPQNSLALERNTEKTPPIKSENCVIYSKKFTMISSHERFRRTLMAGGIPFEVWIGSGIDDEWEHPGDFIISLTAENLNRQWLIDGATFRLPSKGEKREPGSDGLYTISRGPFTLKVSILKASRRYHSPSGVKRFIRTVFLIELTLAIPKGCDKPDVAEEINDNWFGGSLEMNK